jgi:diacylglycerol kinase family enzyme
MTAEPGIRSGVAVRKVLVVANPMARRNAPRLISDLKAAAPADIDWQIIETSARPFASGELEEIAGGADLVVAVGGDGTVTETRSSPAVRPT